MTVSENQESIEQQQEDLERWQGEGGAPQDPFKTLTRLEEALSVQRRPRVQKDRAKRASRKIRLEQDSMGRMEVPANVYYGASTARAVLNFPISGLRLPRSFIRALGLLKLASVRANRDLGILDPGLCPAMEQAAEEVAAGDLDREFVVDVFESGSGTSANTNVNEVISRRATEILGGGAAAFRVHPNDHVNLCQSSNDVFPSAIHLAALDVIETKLEPALASLGASLEAKAHQFLPVLKTGRTHLQDATPIRLGQEFSGYAALVNDGLSAVQPVKERLSLVALGGTAVGTGLNAHPDFAGIVTARLSEMTGWSIRPASNHFAAQSTIQGVLEASAACRGLAVSLAKIANDIRWMASGPRAGLGEIALPEVQPGSSIMPGKRNPVIAESLLQVSAQVIGNDATVAAAAQGGYFELNTMMPVAAHNLLQSISLLAAGAANFEAACIAGLTATDHGPKALEHSLMIATALVPQIGYDLAAEIAQDAHLSGRSVREVARERTSIPAEELDRLLDPASQTAGGFLAEPRRFETPEPPTS